MNTTDTSTALELLRKTHAELTEIHRGSDYGLWRRDTAWRLTESLRVLPPFSAYLLVWVYTGDGGGYATTPKFGDWAIDLMVEKRSPEEILAAFAEEVSNNSAAYLAISPVYGVQIDERCDLPSGVSVTPAPEPGALIQRLVHYETFQTMKFATDTSVLMQPFTVTPAFELAKHNEALKSGESFTAPDFRDRDRFKKVLRLACLLASAGAVEFPDTVTRPGRTALFVGGEGNSATNPYSPRPIVPFPVAAADVKRNLVLLAEFDDAESISRAIDRLGRSRLAAKEVDRALDLGVAIEIALMHDHSSDNNEITHKISSRAAWLIGTTPDERQSIFIDMKKLYRARSQAVHAGALSSKDAIDLNAADKLVVRVLLAILERKTFPNWNVLTMGGSG